MGAWRRSIEFEDKRRNKLFARMEKHSDGWWVFFLHQTRNGKQERGATKKLTDEKRALKALGDLEREARKAGWRYRIVDCTQDAPTFPMRYDDDGRRMFKNINTGCYVYDESSFTPSGSFSLGEAMEDAFSEIFAPQC